MCTRPIAKKGPTKCGWKHGESVEMNTVSASVEMNVTRAESPTDDLLAESVRRAVG